MTKNPTKIIFIILAFLLFFAAPPTSMPRFAAAAMYIPLMLFYLNIFRQKNIFSISLIFGLLFIFPLLEVFRYQISDISNYSFSNMIISSITGGHFDSYQSLMVIIKDGTVTYGLQLAGALLFFFPREFWNDKPIGSGQFMAERLNFSFDNVSANYLSEGFINFGYFGILIFVIVLAVLCGRLDRVFKKGKLVGSPLRVAGYLISLPLLFFTLRGDLMSSFSFLTGFMLAVFVIDKIIKSV